MSDYKFIVDGREYRSYQMSNDVLKKAYQQYDAESEEGKAIARLMCERFCYDNCRHNDGETNADVFARQISDYVNGKMGSAQKTAELMSRDHRYLQQEMFKIFLEYMKILSRNYKDGRYDARNEWACKCSNIAVEELETEKMI